MKSEQCVDTGANSEEQVYQPHGSDLTHQHIQELPTNMRREAYRKLQFVISKQDRGEHLSSADVARLREVTRTY